MAAWWFWTLQMLSTCRLSYLLQVESPAVSATRDIICEVLDFLSFILCQLYFVYLAQHSFLESKGKAGCCRENECHSQPVHTSKWTQFTTMGIVFSRKLKHILFFSFRRRSKKREWFSVHPFTPQMPPSKVVNQLIYILLMAYNDAKNDLKWFWFCLHCDGRLRSLCQLWMCCGWKRTCSLWHMLLQTGAWKPPLS